jgi:hypothetical protein
MVKVNSRGLKPSAFGIDICPGKKAANEDNRRKQQHPDKA